MHVLCCEPTNTENDAFSSKATASRVLNGFKPGKRDTRVSQTSKSGVLHKLLARLRVRQQQRLDRQAFMMMLSLDDKMLQDIGVTRSAVRRAASLPLSENAAQALQQESKRYGHQ